MVEKEAQYLADESGIRVPYIPHLQHTNSLSGW